MQVEVQFHGATTKKDLRDRVKTDPSKIQFAPLDVRTPLHAAFRTTADRIPEGHSALVTGPSGKWTATVTRKGEKIIIR